MALVAGRARKLVGGCGSWSGFVSGFDLIDRDASGRQQSRISICVFAYHEIEWLVDNGDIRLYSK